MKVKKKFESLITIEKIQYLSFLHNELNKNINCPSSIKNYFTKIF